MSLRAEIEKVLEDARQASDAADVSRAEHIHEQKRRMQPWQPILGEMTAAFDAAFFIGRLSGMRAEIRVTSRFTRLTFEIYPDSKTNFKTMQSAPVDGFNVGEQRISDARVTDKSHRFGTISEAAEFLIRQIAVEMVACEKLGRPL